MYSSLWMLWLAFLSSAVWLVRANYMSAAVQSVASDSTDAGIDYFEFETAQLTPEVIANLATKGVANVSLFDFAAPGKPSVPRPPCKAYPGTPEWPPEPLWSDFDSLVGGRLVKTVPLAAPCFSSWPEVKDDSRCAVVKSQWGIPRFQYALHPLSPPAGGYPSSLD